MGNECTSYRPNFRLFAIVEPKIVTVCGKLTELGFFRDTVYMHIAHARNGPVS